MFRCVMSLAAFLILSASSGEAQQFASAEPYRIKAQQATISGVLKETALGYSLMEVKYQDHQQALNTIATDKDTAKHVMTGGKLAAVYRAAEVGNPALYETATAYREGIASALRRAEAGTNFDPVSMDRYLREAQVHLLVMNIHLQQQERAIRRLGLQAYLKNGGSGMIRISPGRPPYRY